MSEVITIETAKSDVDFLTAKNLILEYVAWLGIDLSFQNFNAEMETLTTTYSPPNGALFVALRDGSAVGVAGIKRFSDTVCEVKRMYVQPRGRGVGIGQRLLTHCIAMAKQLNYEMIKLDTSEHMKSAIKLYRQNGFVEISSYRYNPHEEARFFELDLKTISTV
jgi:carbonic anhydrase